MKKQAKFTNLMRTLLIIGAVSYGLSSLHASLRDAYITHAQLYDPKGFVVIAPNGGADFVGPDKSNPDKVEAPSLPAALPTPSESNATANNTPLFRATDSYPVTSVGTNNSDDAAAILTKQMVLPVGSFCSVVTSVYNTVKAQKTVKTSAFSDVGTNSFLGSAAMGNDRINNPQVKLALAKFTNAVYEKTRQMMAGTFTPSEYGIDTTLSIVQSFLNLVKYSLAFNRGTSDAVITMMKNINAAQLSYQTTQKLSPLPEVVYNTSKIN